MKLKLFVFTLCVLTAFSAFAADTASKTETWTGKIIAGAHGATDYWFEAGNSKFELTGPKEALVAPFANHEVTLTGTMNATTKTIEVASVAPMTTHKGAEGHNKPAAH